jgi:hypothetical protein
VCAEAVAGRPSASPRPGGKQPDHEGRKPHGDLRGLRERVRQDDGDHRRGRRAHTFDAFECAIHAIAPRCAHCGVAIIGHGNEAGGSMYCCAHCAREGGHPELADRGAA